MKTIALIDLTDEQFHLFMDLITEIRNKYEGESFVLDYDWNEYREYFFSENSDWKEFKRKRLNVLDEGSKNFLEEFIIFDDEKPVAFIAYKRLSGDRYEFIFDTKYVKTPEEVYVKAFEVLNSFFNESKADHISYLANKISERDFFKNYGIEITQEIVTSKLLRKDIDFEKLRNIVEANEQVKDYDLVLYREIPEEIFDRYIEYMNDVLNAKEFNNPVKEKFEEYKKENLLRSIGIDKEDGAPMYMFMLFDNENIVGSSRVYIEKEDDSYYIQHCGGLTGVAEKYRGKGIAKYLKAKMYLKIMEDYPDFRHAITDTYPWNKYMYRINEDLGFRIFNEGCIFKFTKENLEKIIK